MNQQQNGRFRIDAAETVQRMGEAATDFVASLTTDQRAKCLLDFDDDAKRTFWHYTPIPRDGLPLSEMERHQRQLALKLAASGLSRAGFVTASTIMGIENTLDLFEGWSRPLPGRDPLLYYVSIFGTPGGEAPWSWRFEGHHISLNFTVGNGRILAPTPSFFGSNPAEAPLGATGSLRPLAGIEDLARDLMHELDDAQRATALLAPAAPPDILTTNLARLPFGSDSRVHAPELREDRAHELGFTPGMLESVRVSAEGKGVAGHDLSSGQREIMLALIGEYIQRMPDDVAEIELAALQARGVENVSFAWAGGIERREPHYYRLQGPRFLVEYDNTQNDANHIHSVWRDPANDFGADLLSHHYSSSGHH